MTIPSAIQDIRTKFRRMTAAQTQEQIPDSEIDKYVNTFYMQDLPEHNRMDSLKTDLSFYTQPGVDTYRLGNEVSGPIICPYTQNQIISIEPPAYVNGYEVYMTQSPQQYWRLNPEIRTQEQIFGNGTSGPYTTTLSGTPLLRAYRDNGGILNPRVLITATSGAGVAINIVDDGNGKLLNQLNSKLLGAGKDPNPLPVLLDRGDIDYATGSVTNLTFADESGALVPIPPNSAINFEYVPIQQSRPVMMLFYQGIFFCRPVPDIGYQVSIQAYRSPTVALSDVDTQPELAEWWQMIACGAAMKFFEDNGDFDSYAKYGQLMANYRRLSARRTLAQISRERTPTIYSEAGSWPNVGAQFPYYQY